MKNSMMRLVQLDEKHQQGTVFLSPKDGRLWLTPDHYQKTGADWSLLSCLIVSGVLVTPYWLGKAFLPLPTLTIGHSWLWWLGLAVTTLLPLLFWWQTYHASAWQPDNLQPFYPSRGQQRVLAAKWQGQRLWVIFVLTILPPTTFMFLFFYWWKSDFLDALLITVHGTLFLRRLQPGVWQRLRVSPKVFQATAKKRTTV